MFNETSYDGGPRGMGSFNWGQFLGGIGTALGGALGQNPWGNTGGNTGGQQTPPTAQQLQLCINNGGTWSYALGTCVPRNNTGNDVAFSGSSFFWILAGVVAFSLLSKRR